MVSQVNRCLWRATAGGASPWTVASAITGFLTPGQCTNPIAVDDAIYTYTAESDDLSQWEVGEGRWNAFDNTLTVTTIYESSNGGAAVTFSAAPKVGMTTLLTPDLVGTLQLPDYEAPSGENPGDPGTTVQIFAGDGIGAQGGDAWVKAGRGDSDNGGQAKLEGGAALTDGNGGDVHLTPGSGAGSGRNGLIFADMLPTADPGIPGVLYIDGGTGAVFASL